MMTMTMTMTTKRLCVRRRGSFKAKQQQQQQQQQQHQKKRHYHHHPQRERMMTFFSGVIIEKGYDFKEFFLVRQHGPSPRQTKHPVGVM
jgi:hypothetical protein